MADLARDRGYSGERQRFSLYPARVKVERPLPVTVIALFQFAKGWFLLLVAALASSVPEQLRNVPGLQAFLYFAAHGRGTKGVLLPIVGAYVALTGYGLWRLWGWARRTLILSSAVMVALWIYRFTNDWTAGRATFHTPLEEETVYFLIFLDVVILAYLVLYDGVPQAFAPREF